MAMVVASSDPAPSATLRLIAPEELFVHAGVSHAQSSWWAQELMVLQVASLPWRCTVAH
ncbi:hypothetical protein ACFY2H_39010 [Streptomyces griseofuscus]|uniref:hypothetical protein n=1 Tax=Streptomyces griseofuscus TaxID=146922 RepID=UPI0036793EC0